jgi:hypothetical protein
MTLIASWTFRCVPGPRPWAALFSQVHQELLPNFRSSFHSAESSEAVVHAVLFAREVLGHRRALANHPAALAMLSRGGACASEGVGGGGGDSSWRGFRDLMSRGAFDWSCTKDC